MKIKEPTFTMTVRLPKKALKRLQGVADRKKWSKAFLGGEAILKYLSDEERFAKAVEKSIAGAKAGLPGISHEKMSEWLHSWGTDNELPPPELD